MNNQYYIPPEINEILTNPESYPQVSEKKHQNLFSVNHHLHNKPPKDSKQNFTNFQTRTVGVAEISGVVNKGYAISGATYKGNYRTKANVITNGLWIGDIDDDITIDEFLKLAIAKFCLIYTSPSHKPEHHKFRIICFLPHNIDNNTYEILSKIVNQLIGGYLDPNAMEAGRMFYGNNNAQWFNTNPHQLPIELIAFASKIAKAEEEEKEKAKAKREARRKSHRTSVSSRKGQGFQSVIDEDISTEEIIKALDYIHPDIDYQDWVNIGFALNNHFGGSNEGFSIWDHWSSQGSKYDGTEKLYQKWLSFQSHSTATPITIGTLFFLAKENGYSFPQRESRIPQPGDHPEGEVNFGYSIEEFIKDLDNFEFSEFQEELIRRANNLSKEFKRGFSNKLITIPNLTPASFTYHPKRPLPSREDYKNSNKIPTIIFQQKYKDDIPLVMEKLIKLGWKHIHDKRRTGEGKSHDIPKFSKIIYLDNNYQNPSTKGIKAFPVMMPRTQYGIFKNPDGKIIVDPPDPVDRENLIKISKGNCHLKPVFHHLENKGYNAENDSLPCLKCQHQQYCASYNTLFKGGRKNAITLMKKAGKGRMHPSQFTPDLIRGEIIGDEIENNGVFHDFPIAWEEAGANSGIKSIDFKEHDINTMIAQLTQLSPESLDSSKRDALIKSLYSLTNIMPRKEGKKLSKSNKYYGLEFEEIINNIPTIPEFTEEEKDYLYAVFSPEIDEIIPDDLRNPIGGDMASLRKDVDKSTIKMAENYLRQELKEEMYENLNKVNPNFSLLLDALLGKKGNTLSITSWGSLSVTILNPHLKICSNLAFANIYLDATASQQQLRGIYGIAENEPMIVIKTEEVALNNIQVFNINTKGLKSYDWSDTAINRVKMLIETIKRLNMKMKIAIMCPKKYAEILGTKFYYGRDDRGSNELKDYDAIIFVGTPNVNVGDAKREYQLIYGDDCDFTFEQYYNQLLKENRMQGTGRHRGQWQLEKELHQYYICTDEDLSYFSDLGMEVNNIDAELINPECGKKGDATLLKIKQSIFSLIEASQKVTQQAIADLIGITKQAISKTVSNFEGGWKEFLNSQLLLIETYKGKVDKIKGDESWFYPQWNEDPKTFISLAIDGIRIEGFSYILREFPDLGIPLEKAMEIMWILAPLWDERLQLRNLVMVHKDTC